MVAVGYKNPSDDVTQVTSNFFSHFALFLPTWTPPPDSARKETMRPTSTQLVYGLPEPVGTSTSAIQDLTKTTTLELKAPPRVSELDVCLVVKLPCVV